MVWGETRRAVRKRLEGRPALVPGPCSELGFFFLVRSLDFSPRAMGSH